MAWQLAVVATRGHQGAPEGPRGGRCVDRTAERAFFCAARRRVVLGAVQGVAVRCGAARNPYLSCVMSGRPHFTAGRTAVPSRHALLSLSQAPGSTPAGSYQPQPSTAAGGAPSALPLNSN